MMTLMHLIGAGRVDVGVDMGNNRMAVCGSVQLPVPW